MSRTSRGTLVRLALIMLLAGPLVACGSGGVRVSSASSKPTGGGHDANWALERVQDAIADLNQGEPEKARDQLMKALKVSPSDMLARNLLRQIDTDPRALLGAENFPYVLKEDESLSVLAGRYLHDPMLAYALARYNGLASPLDAKVGQTLLIPGKRPAPPAPAQKKTAPAPAKKPPVVSAKPEPAKPAQPATNPARAARLRGQGLAALNGGAINKAVALLRQALALDPANGTIKADLARALRVQATLSGRR
jgi:tetratricopeptide (TPR) repeat protein